MTKEQKFTENNFKVRNGYVFLDGKVLETVMSIKLSYIDALAVSYRGSTSYWIDVLLYIKGKSEPLVSSYINDDLDIKKLHDCLFDLLLNGADF